MNDTQLHDLVDEKIITGGRETTAESVREVFDQVIDDKQNVDAKNVASGYAGLDADGKLDPDQIPMTWGVEALDGSGVQTDFDVLHGFDGTPENIMITAMSADAAALCYVSLINGTKFVLKFKVAPGAGTGNVRFAWRAK